MGPPSYMRSVVDRNIVMRRIPVNIRYRERLGINSTTYIFVIDFKVPMRFPQGCDYIHVYIYI